MEAENMKKAGKNSWRAYQKELELLRDLDCRPYWNSGYQSHSSPESFVDILTYRLSFVLLTRLLNREGIPVKYDPTCTEELRIEEDMNDDQNMENYDEFVDFYFTEQAPFTFYTDMGCELIFFDTDLIEQKMLKDSQQDGEKKAIFNFLTKSGMDADEMEDETAPYDGIYAYVVKLPGMAFDGWTAELGEEENALYLKCKEYLTNNSAYCGLECVGDDLYHVVLIGVEDDCCWTEADYGAAAFYAAYLLKLLYKQSKKGEEKAAG